MFQDKENTVLVKKIAFLFWYMYIMKMACKLGHHSWALPFATARELQVINSTYQQTYHL